MGQSHGDTGHQHKEHKEQHKADADAAAEAALKAIKEERMNRWKKYEYHHQPDLTELSETCYPLKSRCRVIKVSNIGLLEDAEGKTMSFVDDPKGEYTAKPDEHIVRLVCLSDSHSGAKNWLEKGAVPDGDVFIFAGDMTGKGTIAEVAAFVEFVKQLPHKHKIVVAGNHDLVLDQEYYEYSWKTYHKTKEGSPDEILAELKKVCTYLVDEMVEVEGLRIFASPRSPEFCTWAFPVFPDDVRYWDHSIHKACGTEPVDVVVTHGPLPGHGSLCVNGSEAGDFILQETLQTKYIPALSVAGHVHEGYGCTNDPKTGTVFINASGMDQIYRPVNRMMVVDVAVPN